MKHKQSWLQIEGAKKIFAQRVKIISFDCLQPSVMSHISFVSTY